MKLSIQPLLSARKLMAGLIVSSLNSVVSPVVIADSDVMLTMAWQAETRSLHRWKMELLAGDDINIQEYRLEGSFRQSIAAHNEGLLITRDEVDVSKADYNVSGVSPSLPQMLFVRASALMMFSAPDHVITPDGRLLGIENTEAFKTAQIEKMTQLFSAAGRADSLADEMLPMIESTVTDMDSYRESIRQDLSLWAALNGIGLSIDQPLKTTLPVAAGMAAHAAAEQGMQGELQFVGTVACSDTSAQKKCAELRFNSSAADGVAGEQMQLQVDILVEPATLTPHRVIYSADSGVTGSVKMEHAITYIE